MIQKAKCRVFQVFGHTLKTLLTTKLRSWFGVPVHTLNVKVDQITHSGHSLKEYLLFNCLSGFKVCNTSNWASCTCTVSKKFVLPWSTVNPRISSIPDELDSQQQCIAILRTLEGDGICKRNQMNNDRFWRNTAQQTTIRQPQRDCVAHGLGSILPLRLCAVQSFVNRKAQNDLS